MGRLLSGRTAIPSILTLLVLALIVAFQDYYQQAYAPTCIAVVWLVAFLVYQRQRVNIELHLIRIEKKEGGVNVRLTGSIWSRHPSGLYALELYIIHSFGIRTMEEGSDLPKSIDIKMQKFIANFYISDDVLRLAVSEQGSDGVNIAFILSVKMRGGDILYRGLNVHPFFVADEKIWGEVIETKGEMPEEGKKQNGLGISKKQFAEIIKTASQPLEKSEKEKP